MRRAQPVLVVAAMRGVFLTALMVPFAGAQTQEWIRQLGTSGDDGASAAAPDGSGGFYVTGQTPGSIGGPNAGFTDAWIARYDGAGIQTWIRQLGSSSRDSAYSAAPDGAGGVYAIGYTNGSLGGPHAGSTDAWIARYDGAGNLSWIRQLGTAEFDWAEGAASDGSGGVYVTGFTYGSLGGPSSGDADAWLARYDGAGNQTWVRQLGTIRSNQANGAAPDGAGGVYVTGYTNGSLGGPSAGSTDAWIARYDEAGNQTWIRQLGTSSSDYAKAAALDGSGGVYVSGFTYGGLGGPSAGDADAWLARYDGTGNQTWIRQLGTSRSDYAGTAAPDGAGGVYVGGTTDGILGGPDQGIDDAWLACYDATGEQIWIQQLGTSHNDSTSAAAPDGAGGVFVTGTTSGSLGGANVGGSDAWLARYESLETVRYCTPAIPNSTGHPGVLTAAGTAQVAANDLVVAASQLPPNAFGVFLASRNQGLIVGPGGSQGNLCLGGSIGRFVGPGQIKNSGAAGTLDLVLDLTMLPTPTGFVAVQPSETWNFQVWYRDASPGPTSNFTDAFSIGFY